MTRRINVSAAKKDNTQQLLAFLLKKHGGEEAVYREFYGQQLGELASQDLTLAEVRANADKEGWLATLDGMKMTSIANIINPQSIAPSRPGKPKGKRLTKEQKAKALDDTLVFLATNPWKSKNEIAEGINFDAGKLGALLRALKEEEKVKTVGERAGMKYALQSEKSKP